MKIVLAVVLLVAGVSIVSNSFAAEPLSDLQNEARCLIATHHFTKVTTRQRFLSGIYSIYLQNAGEAVGSGGAILYTTDKIYSLDLAPAIATVRGNSDSPYFGGWIVIDGSGDPIFTQYYSKPTKDDSPLSVTGAPFNAPSNEGHARMVEITSSDSDLIQKVTIAFEEALATAKQRVIAKLKTVSKKDADLAVKDLSPCSGILKIADE